MATPYEKYPGKYDVIEVNYDSEEEQDEQEVKKPKVKLFIINIEIFLHLREFEICIKIPIKM